MRRRIRRPCLDCGRPAEESRCRKCAARHEAARLERQPYRVAYSAEFYHRSRAQRFRLARGRCEAIVEGERCAARAVECHHVVPLSSAMSMAEAISLCAVANLRAVCFKHNPRGGSAKA